MKHTFKFELKTSWHGTGYRYYDDEVGYFICRQGVRTLYGYDLGDDIEITVSDREIPGRGVVHAINNGSDRYLLVFEDGVVGGFDVPLSHGMDHLLAKTFGKDHPSFYFYITVPA